MNTNTADAGSAAANGQPEACQLRRSGWAGGGPSALVECGTQIGLIWCRAIIAGYATGMRGLDHWYWLPAEPVGVWAECE